MPDLESTIAVDLAARYKKLALVAHDLASPLSDDQFWTKPFPFGNSFGHLLLHITGNLNYYIGAQIANTGYVRNRPLEFSDANRLPKTDVLKQFDDAVELTVATIASQRGEDWTREYSGAGSEAHHRFEIVLQCVTHLHHHIGQMMYLAFALKSQ
jgi:uncharacterized damage-inducible protein DinB